MNRPALDSLVSTGGNLGWALLRGKLVALFLGPVGMGLFSQLTALQGMGTSIALLGAGPGFVREYAAARGRGDEPAMARTLATSGVTCLLAVGLVGLALGALGEPLAQALLADPRLAGVFPVLALALLGSAIHQFGVSVWGAMRATRWMALASVVALLGGGVLFVSFLSAGSLGSAVAGLAAASMAPAGVALWFLAKAWPRPLPRLDFSAAARIYSVGGMSLALVTLDQVAQLWLRTDLITRLGAAENGIYQAAAGFSQMSLMLASTYLTGSVFSLVCEVEGARRAEVVQRAAGAVVAALSLVGGVYVLAGDLLIRLLLSAEFLAATEVLVWQAAGDVLAGGGMALGLLLLPSRGTVAWGLHGVASVATQWGVYLLLPESLGLHRIAIAWSARGAAHLVVGCLLGRVVPSPRLLGLLMGALLVLAALAALAGPGVPARAAGLALLAGWLALLARLGYLRELGRAVPAGAEPQAPPCSVG